VRRRRNGVWVVVATLAVLLVAGVGTVSPPSSGGASGPVGPSATFPGPTEGRVLPGGLASPGGGAGGNATIGPVYASTTVGSGPNPLCFTENFTTFLEQYCLHETQNPTILNLSNGDLGLGYSVYTPAGPTCNVSSKDPLPGWTTSNVAWTRSTTHGASWGPPTFVGTGNCRWPSSSEPTFATGPAGSVDGAFILSNQSVNTSHGPRQPALPPDWGNTTGDAIGFVNSSNNGRTWSNVTVVPNITGAARPAMAVFGRTIYIAYVFVPNTSAIYPTGGFLQNPASSALAVDLIVSPDAGSTWNGPYSLPGENASMGNWSTSPSVAVNSNGTLAVAYATNRTCVEYCYYGAYSTFADDIVVATSDRNGTSWTGPTTVASLVGEDPSDQEYEDKYLEGDEYPWQTPPTTSVAYGAPNSLFVAYAGTYLVPAATYLDWEDMGVFAGVSRDGGTTWTDSTVSAPGSSSNFDDLYSPSVGVSGTTAYVAYVWSNESSCSRAPCDPLDGGYSSWIASSPNGVNWTSTYAGSLTRMPDPSDAEEGWQGWVSSLAFIGGQPVTATTLPVREQVTHPTMGVADFVDRANVEVGYATVAPTTYVRFVEQNLPPGTSWGVALDGYVLATNATVLNVTNVPVGVDVPLATLPPPAEGYRVIEVSTLGAPAFGSFGGPTTVDVNFTRELGLWFTVEPAVVPYTYLDACGPVGCDSLDVGPGYSNAYPPMPWYFPSGVIVQAHTGGSVPVTYWNGTGPGSVTGGSGAINMTVTNPVNETAWVGTFGTYTETFYPVGLPTGSTYSFAFNGSRYATVSASWTNVTGVPTGGYTVTNISATNATPGWEYFGKTVGGSDVVVVPDTPVIGLQFADVNVGAPVGTVTFHASGFGNRTVWSVEFNGTDYSSSTPWLNVTTHPGTYPWSVGSAVAANGSVGYAPVVTGPTVSVTSGSTVDILYRSAYRVDVLAGLGGSVSGAGNHWLANGSNATYVAIPASGYGFEGWTGSGHGSYSGPSTAATVTVGGAIVESATFVPLPSARFNLTFQQTTVPSGTWWTVSLDGVGYSTNGSRLVVPDLLSCAAGAAGQYTVGVPDAYNGSTGSTRFSALSPPGQLCTDGGTVVTLTFVPEYEVTLSQTPNGTSFLADEAVASAVSLWAAPTDTVSLSATPSQGYRFGGWNGTGIGSYTGTSEGTVLSPGGPVEEFVTFVPLPTVPQPTYSERFTASVPFPTGTSWTLALTAGGRTTRYAAVGPILVAPGLPPMTYSASVGPATSSDGLTKWSPTAPVFPVEVTGNQTWPVGFGSPSYWVSIGGSAGGTVLPSSGWFRSGAELTLNATPDLGTSFVGWQGSGPGNYTGNNTTGAAVVLGLLTEYATFAPTPNAVATVASVWAEPGTLAALGVVGLVLGVAAGFLILRKERGVPPREEPVPNEAWSEDSSAGPVDGPPDSDRSS
jgi:hypothetical protein